MTVSQTPRADTRALFCGRLVAYVTLFGLIGGFLWTYRTAFYKGLGYPFNTLFFRPEVASSDLTDFYSAILGGSPLSTDVAVYPPFSYVVMEPFARIGGGESIAAFALITCVGIAAYATYELSSYPPVDRAALVAVLAFFNFPVLFALDRANIDVVAALLVAGAVVAIQARRPTLGASLIGAAAAMKIYPAIFLLLLLRRRQWWPVAAGVAVAAVLTLASFALYGYGPLNGVSILSERLSVFTTKYAVGDMGLQFGSSLWGLAKVLLVPDFVSGESAIRSLLTAYTAVSIILGLLVVAAVVKLPLDFWEQATMLTAAALILPSVSSDYRLVMLVVPLALFLRHGTGVRYAPLLSLLFALLLIPKPYAQLRPPDVNIGVVVNPILLLAIVGLVAGAGLLRLRSERASAQRNPDSPASGASPA